VSRLLSVYHLDCTVEQIKGVTESITQSLLNEGSAWTHELCLDELIKAQPRLFVDVAASSSTAEHKVASERTAARDRDTITNSIVPPEEQSKLNLMKTSLVVQRDMKEDIEKQDARMESIERALQALNDGMQQLVKYTRKQSRRGRRDTQNTENAQDDQKTQNSQSTETSHSSNVVNGETAESDDDSDDNDEASEQDEADDTSEEEDDIDNVSHNKNEVKDTKQIHNPKKRRTAVKTSAAQLLQAPPTPAIHVSANPGKKKRKKTKATTNTPTQTTTNATPVQSTSTASRRSARNQ